MDTDIKNKFLKTSESYLKITERNASAANMQNSAVLSLEKKMSRRFLHNPKSRLLDKIS